jgi:hypothetical protein
MYFYQTIAVTLLILKQMSHSYKFQKLINLTGL